MAYSMPALVWAVGLFKTTDKRVVNSKLAEMVKSLPYTMTFDSVVSGGKVTVPSCLVRWVRYPNGQYAVNSITGEKYLTTVLKHQHVPLTEIRPC